MATKDNTAGLFNSTAPAVMAFPALHTPRAYKKDGRDVGEPKYGASFLFPTDHPDLKAMKAKAAEVAKARWPNRDLKSLSFPFALGDKLIAQRKEKTGKDDSDFMAGMVVVKAKSKYPPTLSGIDGGKIINYDTEVAIAASKTKFYFGVEVLCQVNFVAYEGKDGDGVTTYLNMVLTTNKGKKLGGAGRDASQSFSGYLGTYSNADPTGMDDEIPF